MAKGKWEKWIEPNHLLILGAWARDGLTDEDIAHNIGISRSTLKEWKKKMLLVLLLILILHLIFPVKMLNHK